MPTIEVQSGRVSYASTGEGDPVIALHSSACASAQWGGLAETISAQFRLSAPDLIGYGSSDPWPGPGPLGLDDEVRRVEAVIEAAGRETGQEGRPVHLVGHSYGGAVALQLALTRGWRLASLTLIEPVAFGLLRGGDPIALRAYGEIRRLGERVSAEMAEGAAERAMRGFVDYWNGAGAWQAMSERQRAGVLRVAAKVPQDFHAVFAAETRLEDCARLAVPTLLIAGGRTPLPTRRLYELLAATIPASEGLMLRGAGHMAPMTHADAVNRAIARHVAAHRSDDFRLPLAA